MSFLKIGFRGEIDVGSALKNGCIALARLAGPGVTEWAGVRDEGNRNSILLHPRFTRLPGSRPFL